MRAMPQFREVGFARRGAEAAIVGALAIAGIDRGEAVATLRFVDAKAAPMDVDASILPIVGGVGDYLVMDDAGELQVLRAAHFEQYFTAI